MKLTLALLAAVAVAQDDDVVADDVWQGAGAAGNQPAIARSGADRNNDERRYGDLKDIAKKVWQKNGLTGKDRFDEKKYWAYGCHCIILGDRPMTEMGKGTPTDALDNGCKAYKDCQKCVRQKHGDQCIGEFVRYTWKWSTKENGFVSRDEEGSCARELFHCDVMMAYNTFDNRAAYSNDYHLFYSTTGFDPELEGSCPSGGSAPVEHMCCGGVNKPYYWMNMNQKECVNGVPQEK